MKVGILSDSIIGAIRIYKQISKIKECKTYILLCNNNRMGVYKYVIIQVYSLISTFSLKNLCLFFKAFFTKKVVLIGNGLKERAMQGKLKKLDLDIGLHNTSVIYNAEIISCFKKGILNSHIGILPKYRGRCVMEWSLFYGDKTGISTFYIDEGIDTGKNIVILEPVDVLKETNITSAKNKLFKMDGIMYAKAIMTEVKGFKFIVNDCSGTRFYVMSELFRSAIENKYFKN